MGLVVLVLLVTLGAAALIHWLGYLHVWGADTFIGGMSHELEMALLVAFVLTLTVEVINRIHHKRVVSEINENVFKATLKRNLPPSIYQELDRSILQAKVYRDSCEMEITITDRGDDTVLLEVGGNYELVNMTGSSTNHQAQLKIDLNHRHPQECRLLEFTVGEGRLSDKDFKKHCHRTPDYETFSKSIPIRGNDRCKIAFRYQTVLNIQDAESICAVTPSVSLSLSVITPNKDFDLSVESMHLSEPKRVKQGPVNFQWRIEQALLPCQGLQLYWKKKVVQPPAPASTGKLSVVKVA